MSYNIVDAGLNRFNLMYYDKTGESFRREMISNFEKIRSYMKYRMNEGLAPDTLSNDVKALIEFSRVINKPFKELTPDDIYEFFSC